tara:strand:+ start:1185 stop:1382 length:198 start_codon:yes stop_codon:yes gene_type:complete
VDKLAIAVIGLLTIDFGVNLRHLSSHDARQKRGVMFDLDAMASDLLQAIGFDQIYPLELATVRIV